MAQRVRRPYRGTSPSSAVQLPVPAALYARSPTLFPYIIHAQDEKVNPHFYFLLISSNELPQNLFCKFPEKSLPQCQRDPCNLWDFPL